MAASDNVAAASADLRRLATLNEADLLEALSGMGREPFRRLRRAVGRTATPLPSGDEGGSGPSGAQTVSDPYRLDPAVNAENQVTAPSGANLNNLDPTTDTYAFLAAVSSPVASMPTQDPLWPPSLGDTTSLDDYLAEQSQGTAPTAGDTISTSAPTAGFSSSPATAPTTLVATQAQPGETLPAQGEGTTPEGPPTPGATRSRANKILPTATGAEQTVRQLADQIDSAAKPPTKAVPRKQPPVARPKRRRRPTSRRRPPRHSPMASRPPPPQHCALRIAGRPASSPQKSKNSAGPGGGRSHRRIPPSHQWWRPAGRTGAPAIEANPSLQGKGAAVSGQTTTRSRPPSNRRAWHEL